MKKRLAMLMALALSLNLFVGCGNKQAETSDSQGNGDADQAQTITLKLADPNSEASMFHLGLLEIANEVESATDGRVKIEIYPNAQLGDTAAATDGVRMGTIDMAITNSACLANIIPEFAVLDAPFVIKDDDHAQRVVSGEVGEYFDNAVKEKDATIVGWFCGGSRNLFSTKPVDSIEAFKGLKVRTMDNSIHMDTFNALGAIATPMAYSELFTALQQHTVDAGENAIDNILTANFYEVCPYVTLTAHFYNFLQVIISDNALNQMDDDLQQTFLAACEAGTAKANELIRNQNEASKAALEEKGVTFYEVDHDKLVELVQPVYETYASSMPEDLVKDIRDA